MRENFTLMVIRFIDSFYQAQFLLSAPPFLARFEFLTLLWFSLSKQSQYCFDNCFNRCHIICPLLSYSFVGVYFSCISDEVECNEVNRFAFIFWFSLSKFLWTAKFNWTLLVTIETSSIGTLRCRFSSKSWFKPRRFLKIFSSWLNIPFGLSQTQS